MQPPIDYATTDDPLYRDVPLDHHLNAPVLGIPVRFSSNARAVIDVAEAAFGAWRGLDPALIEPEEVHVRIIVHPGDEGGAEHAPLYYRVIPSHRVLVGSPGSAAIADPDRREAVAFVTASLAADREHFRYGVVEALTMALVTFLDRQPFHAACLVRDGTALLLAGPSGVGKSSLAYAALRADMGFKLLTEDTVFLQSKPRLRIWGLPAFIHLPTDLGDRFPELDPLSPTVLANGKRKLAVDARAIGAVAESPVVERAGLCILDRQDGPPGIRRVSADESLHRLATARRESGFDLFAETIREPLRLLTERGGWVLSLPDDPRQAVTWLDDVLGRIGEPAPPA